MKRCRTKSSCLALSPPNTLFFFSIHVIFAFECVVFSFSPFSLFQATFVKSTQKKRETDMSRFCLRVFKALSPLKPETRSPCVVKLSKAHFPRAQSTLLSWPTSQFCALSVSANGRQHSRAAFVTIHRVCLRDTRAPRVWWARTTIPLDDFFLARPFRSVHHGNLSRLGEQWPADVYSLLAAPQLSVRFPINETSIVSSDDRDDSQTARTQRSRSDEKTRTHLVACARRCTWNCPPLRRSLLTSVKALTAAPPNAVTGSYALQNQTHNLTDRASTANAFEALPGLASDPLGAEVHAGNASHDSGSGDDDSDAALMLDLFDDLLSPSGEDGGDGPDRPLDAFTDTKRHDTPLQHSQQHLQQPTAEPTQPTRSSNSYLRPLTAAALSPTSPLDDFQMRAVELALQGHNLFLTGGAGTGKSLTVRHIVAALRAREDDARRELRAVAGGVGAADHDGGTSCEAGGHAAENEDASDADTSCSAERNGGVRATSRAAPTSGSPQQQPRLSPSTIYVTATTGLAAVQLVGTTIHNFSGVGFGGGDPEQLLRRVRKSSRAASRWRRCTVLIIDEISMLDPGLFEGLDYVARRLRRQASVPFGGIQVILCGDFFQLAPILRRPDARSGVSPTPSSLPRYAERPPSFSSAVPAATASAASPSTAPTQPFVIHDLDDFLRTSAPPAVAAGAVSSGARRQRRASARTVLTAAQQRDSKEAFAHATTCAYAFQTVAWGRLQLWPIVLPLAHRQASDVSFQRILDEVRRGALSMEGCRALAARSVVDGRDGRVHRPGSHVRGRETNSNSDDGTSSRTATATTAVAELPIRLCATNTAVDARNAFFFAQLPPMHPFFLRQQQQQQQRHQDGQQTNTATATLAAPCHTFYAYDTQDTRSFFTSKYYAEQRFSHPSASRNQATSSPSSALLEESGLPREIALKVGTRVLLASNVAPRYRLVNGTVGEIVGFLHPLEMTALVYWTMRRRQRRYAMARNMQSTRDSKSEGSANLGKKNLASERGTEEEEEEMPPWVVELRRRGGFSEASDDDVVFCIETSQALPFRTLFWKMLRHVKGELTAYNSSAGERRPLSRQARNALRQLRADNIPYNAFFSSNYCTNVLRITRSPLQLARKSSSSPPPPFAHQPSVAPLESCGARFAFPAPSPLSRHSNSTPAALWTSREHRGTAPPQSDSGRYRQSFPSSSTPSNNDVPGDNNNGKSRGTDQPPWLRRLCDLTEAERQHERLPIFRCTSPLSASPPTGPPAAERVVFSSDEGLYRRRHGTRYAMIAPYRHTSGDEDVSEDDAKSEKGGYGRAAKKADVTSRTQLPLRYAWALTVHKSQGLTLSPVEVDMAKVVSVGQAYVALSRAPKLEALSILNFDPAVIAASPVVKRFYASLQEPQVVGSTATCQETSSATAPAFNTNSQN